MPKKQLFWPIGQLTDLPTNWPKNKQSDTAAWDKLIIPKHNDMRTVGEWSISLQMLQMIGNSVLPLSFWRRKIQVWSSMNSLGLIDPATGCCGQLVKIEQASKQIWIQFLYKRGVESRLWQNLQENKKIVN